MRLIKLFTMTVMAIAILCLSAVQQANARVPMINEDLTWVYVNSWSYLHGGHETYYCKYEMKFVGTTEKNNHVYHNFRVVHSVFIQRLDHAKMLEYGPDQVGNIKLLREDGDKVWYFDNDRNGEILMYDFSVKTGDPAPGYQDGLVLSEDKYTTAFVLPDTIISGVQRRVYSYSFDGNNPWPEDTRCIEGIGTTRGTLCNIMADIIATASPDSAWEDEPGQAYTHLSAVIDKDGNYIYGRPCAVDNILADIDAVRNDYEESAEYYNLQGTKLSNPRAGEIVIKVQGGQAEKVVYQE